MADRLLKPAKRDHIHAAFCGHFTPAAVRWWATALEDAYGRTHSHHRILRDMIGSRSVEEAEALNFCYERVVNQHGGHKVTGEWCVCLSEQAPGAGEARGSLGSDGFSTLLSLAVDLEQAADTLPISWKSTERVFIAQGRSAVWGARFTYYNRNLRVREIDRWLEPRDTETGRPRSTSLTYWLMARSLGGTKDVCAWPRPDSIVERQVFRALSQGRIQQEAA